MADDTRDPDFDASASPSAAAQADGTGPAQDAGQDASGEEPKTRGLFEGVARAIGRTAGRTKDALARLGERGALALAVRRVENQRALKLNELGLIVHKALSLPEGLLRRDDPRVAEVMQNIDRLDKKLARMRERIEKGAEAADEESSREPGSGDEAKAGEPLDQ